MRYKHYKTLVSWFNSVEHNLGMHSGKAKRKMFNWAKNCLENIATYAAENKLLKQRIDPAGLNYFIYIFDFYLHNEIPDKKKERDFPIAIFKKTRTANIIKNYQDLIKDYEQGKT